MKIETLQLGQAVLTVYLREPSASMPQAAARPLVLVVPGGGYEHVSDREGDPVAVRFLAEGYHAAVLRYSVGEGARGFLRTAVAGPSGRSVGEKGAQAFAKSFVQAHMYPLLSGVAATAGFSCPDCARPLPWPVQGRLPRPWI